MTGLEIGFERKRNGSSELSQDIASVQEWSQKPFEDAVMQAACRFRHESYMFQSSPESPVLLFWRRVPMRTAEAEPQVRDLYARF